MYLKNLKKRVRTIWIIKKIIHECYLILHLTPTKNRSMYNYDTKIYTCYDSTNYDDIVHAH